jgi:phosphocarrier protein HPr
MRRELKVMNQLGLHARPAAEFVRAAQMFQSTLTIWKDDEPFSAASILEVLTANLDYGAVFVLEAEGSDAEAALERIARLMVEFQHQEECPGA